MRRCGLRDDQWNRIEDSLPGSDGWVGVTARDNRRFVEAVQRLLYKRGDDAVDALAGPSKRHAFTAAARPEISAQRRRPWSRPRARS